MRIVAETTGRLLVELDDGTDVTYIVATGEVRPLGPLTRHHILGPGWREWSGDAELEQALCVRVGAHLAS